MLVRVFTVRHLFLELCAPHVDLS